MSDYHNPAATILGRFHKQFGASSDSLTENDASDGVFIATADDSLTL